MPPQFPPPLAIGTDNPRRSWCRLRQFFLLTPHQLPWLMLRSTYSMPRISAPVGYRHRQPAAQLVRLRQFFLLTPHQLPWLLLRSIYSMPPQFRPSWLSHQQPAAHLVQAPSIISSDAAPIAVAIAAVYLQHAPAISAHNNLGPKRTDAQMALGFAA